MRRKMFLEIMYFSGKRTSDIITIILTSNLFAENFVINDSRAALYNEKIERFEYTGFPLRNRRSQKGTPAE